MTSERDDLIAMLDKQRGFLRHTVKGVSDADAARRTTVSDLCLGGLVQHVTRVEQRWAGFVVDGPSAMAMNPESMAQHAASFEVNPGDTLAGLLERYDEAAAATTQLIRTLPSLDAAQPLPDAPWFPPATTWTARRVFMHIAAETAQHCGHADILREALDGQKTMG